MFSSRVPGELEPNRLAVAVARARQAGRPIVDLTISNPTVAGIGYPESLLNSLADPRARRYDPVPFGMMPAREAVSREYARRGIEVPADRIVLTASTSEAYSFLFKLLCAPTGDAVMAPVPSYPLFDHLTRLDGVGCIPYRLEYHGRWTVELDDVDRVWTNKVRAVLAVNPNNPTGSVLTPQEMAELAGRCAARNAALIVDEVFADFPLHGSPLEHETAWQCLAFRLGGLSKSAGLPQVKLGWMAVEGPDALVRDALARLELICDTYLSVATPVQVAAPTLVAEGAAVRRAIQERVRGNYAAAARLAAQYPSVNLLHADAGWSVVLRVPFTRPEEDLVIDLLERDGVLVHPGFFFDFPHESFIVVSLLPPRDGFEDGLRRVLERARA
jgi:aspartate/methionine/tyrosine aminotransferase